MASSACGTTVFPAAPSDSNIDYEVLPLFRVYKDGSVERLIETESIPAGTDARTGVTSKDITIAPNSEIYVRLYLPAAVPSFISSQKLPLLIYFHGGAFCLSTPASRNYHNYLNKLVAEGQVVGVSVHYRRPPEHPLPIAYEDSWAAMKWVGSHSDGNGPEDWLNNYADFGRVFLAGESAGGNIVHNMAMRAGTEESDLSFRILGVALVHPFFWGSVPVGKEADRDPADKAIIDELWSHVCPSSPDNDDPRVNPVAEGAPSLALLGCRKVFVSVAENDALRDRGCLYNRALSQSSWKGAVQLHETLGESHAFHLYNLDCKKAKELIGKIVSFFNSGVSLDW